MPYYDVFVLSDENECETQAPACGKGKYCVNQEGSFQCFSKCLADLIKGQLQNFATGAAKLLTGECLLCNP